MDSHLQEHKMVIKKVRASCVSLMVMGIMQLGGIPEFILYCCVYYTVAHCWEYKPQPVYTYMKPFKECCLLALWV